MSRSCSFIPAIALGAFLCAGTAPVVLADTAVPSDFNGDGFSDLLIGVPGKVIDDQGFNDNEQGAAFVAYSNGSAISFSGEQYWHQNSAGVAGASERNDFFARAMATGDFDNDGYSDAVFGVPGENIDAPFPLLEYYDAGMINVVYGSPNGLNSNDTESFTQDTANVLGGVETGDFFGSALAVGDFDRDGYDDLAVGIPGEEIDPGPEGGGAVQIFYGNGGGVSTRDQFWHQDNTSVGSTAELNDEFGSALATGDFDGDGYDDLAIGAPKEDIGNENDAGMVTVLYGGSGGLSTSGDQGWHQDSSGIQGAAETNDFFGAALAAGDFNDDGFDDLAIGVPEENLSGGINAGAVQILMGSANGLTSSDYFIDLSGSRLSFDMNIDDKFGSALAAGDFDGDGDDDLAISAPSKGSDKEYGCGMVWIIRWDNAITHFREMTVLPGQGCVVVAVDGEQFGATLQALDINGDGISDLAVGAPNSQGTSSTRAGKVYTFMGPINILNKYDTVQQDRLCCSNPVGTDDFGATLPGSSWWK